MNTVEKGFAFEEEAIKFLEEQGYNLVEWASRKNWRSRYDLIVEKDGQTFYVEVRGTTVATRPTMPRAKFEFLKKLGNSLVVLITPSWKKVLTLKEAPYHVSIYGRRKRLHLSLNRWVDISQTLKSNRRVLKPKVPMDSKGRILIPKWIRDELGLKKKALAELDIYGNDKILLTFLSKGEET